MHKNLLAVINLLAFIFSSHRTKDPFNLRSKHIKKLTRKSHDVTTFHVSSFEILHKSLLFDRSRKVCTLLETSVQRIRVSQEAKFVFGARQCVSIIHLHTRE